MSFSLFFLLSHRYCLCVLFYRPVVVILSLSSLPPFCFLSMSSLSLPSCSFSPSSRACFSARHRFRDHLVLTTCHRFCLHLLLSAHRHIRRHFVLTAYHRFCFHLFLSAHRHIRCHLVLLARRPFRRHLVLSAHRPDLLSVHHHFRRHLVLTACHRFRLHLFLSAHRHFRRYIVLTACYRFCIHFFFRFIVTFVAILFFRPVVAFIVTEISYLFTNHLTRAEWDSMFFPSRV